MSPLPQPHFSLQVRDHSQSQMEANIWWFAWREWSSVYIWVLRDQKHSTWSFYLELGLPERNYIIRWFRRFKRYPIIGLHFYPEGATYIPLHVVITDQTLSFFTQSTDMTKDWKVTLTTDLLCKKDTIYLTTALVHTKIPKSPTLKATITLFTDDRKRIIITRASPFPTYKRQSSWCALFCTQPGNSVHSATHSKFTLNKTLMSLSTVLSVRSTVAGPVRIYCTSVDC